MFDFKGNTVVLASSSPRRKDLLSGMGIDFEVISPDIDETLLKGENPRFYALRMAKGKATEVAKTNPNKIIIAADTSVFHGKRLIDKAETNEDVRKFLSQLSGRNHIVHSGLAVIFPDGSCVQKHVGTKVKFKRLSESEINHYIASKEGIGKAGGYAVQGIGATFIANINGSYSGVVGLPIYELSQILKAKYGK